MIGLNACVLSPDTPFACTEEFRMITLEISGDTLDRTYTLRNGVDTAAATKGPEFGNVYLVLDDFYRYKIEGSQEAFLFHGYIGDSLVVVEDYIISADACHVNKESGKASLAL